jgi:hypothetical protein
VGYVKLRAFYPWIRNEESRVIEFQRYKEEELTMNFWVGHESTKLGVILRNHAQMVLDVEIIILLR